MVIFYTLPPAGVPYPYILINARNPNINYIIDHHRFVKKVIVDSGVEIFRNPSIKDYSHDHFNKLVSVYRRTKTLIEGEVYVTVPDYPDDYHPKALWVNGKTNIERTLDNIVYALTSYPDINWLIPVQGHNKQPKSVIMALELYNKKDVPLNKYIAIANLCVEKSGKVMVETVKLAHNWLMRNGLMPKIHIFGPTVSAIAKLSRYIYSFDSTAWTKPRKPNGWSAKNSKERIWLFIAWLYKYSDIIDIPLER